MKKEVFQKIISNIVVRMDSLAITRDFLEKNYPEAIEKSQNANKGFTFLYRVIALPGSAELKEFRENDCTSKSIESCARIADDMPGMVSFGGKMEFVKKELFRFKVPSERIILDFDAIMSELELAAELYPDVCTYDKDDCEISAKRALELYKKNEEKEVIADLRGMKYISQDISQNTYKISSLLRDYRDGEKTERGSCFRMTNQNPVSILESMMTKKDFADFSSWYESLEKAPVSDRPKRKKRKFKASLEGSEPAF